MSSSRLNLEYYLISLEEIQSATEHFSPKTCIGYGGFGTVYKGELSQRWQNRTAAIKRLNPNNVQRVSEFRNELEIVSRFQHKNIISFIGFCDEGNEKIIVYEYAINGSLHDHIRDPIKRCCITWIQRLKICIGAARGLRYLHLGLGEHNSVIHRDIKSENILLDECLVAKVSDFGLSILHPRNSDYTNIAGTNWYIDPSYNESGIPQKESDVYSFGVVLFEMLSGSLVYRRRSIDDNMGHTLIPLVRRCFDNEVYKLIDPQIRDQFDSRSFDKFSKIAYQCISYKPMERPTMDMVIDRIEEALDIEKNDAALIECIMEDIGFSHGIPVLSLTIYKCLLNQKYLTAEKTTVFDQLLRIFKSAIEDRDDNNQMAYWLSNASTLLFLIQQSLRAPPPALLSGKVKEIFHSVNLAEDAVMIVHRVEAKNPAFLFEQQLTEYVEKVYAIICDNLKDELGPLLSLCIGQAPAKSKGVLTSEMFDGKHSRFNYWQGIVNRLNNLLNKLKENFVPSIIVQKIFAHSFSCINVELFNSLLQGQECCTVSNGEYMKDGLAELEHWCYQSKEYTGSAWDKLKHIRQAIRFLIIHEKRLLSYDKFVNDLCPILSLQQLYKIWILYWGDNNAGLASSNVISSLRILLSKESNDASSNSFLLDDLSSIPFSVDDLSISLQVKDFANVKPALQQLSKYGAFHFLYN